MPYSVIKCLISGDRTPSEQSEIERLPPTTLVIGCPGKNFTLGAVRACLDAIADLRGSDYLLRCSEIGKIEKRKACNSWRGILCLKDRSEWE